MKGYSKINLMKNSNKSRSMDFSDQTATTPRFQKPISTKKPTIKTNQQQPKIPDEDDDYKHYSNTHHQEEDGNFPMKMLNRNHSVSSNGTTIDSKGTTALSSRFKIEKQNSTGRTLQTSVKRAFSIRRSSSVSESYSRIHDQYVNTIDLDDNQEQEEDLKMTRSINNMKKQNRGSILKACKRIFGL